ncbi:hypothetical protein Acaty_c0181 [Acidithiobacillus caldus ATCC 51756]|uniref:Uncharacterized protein n=1 Tax=Acidithiobacillus caldus (strain ATCC 51756 / DSM 8584 / KU) TaxID=637389 RepID=A0A059ZVY2_ACICK|nr:hypothetical protein Acaty_c0181 [Acidithiobacillus caldus ATCC 51756]
MNIHAMESNTAGLEADTFLGEHTNLMLDSCNSSFLGIRDSPTVFCQEGNVWSNKDHDEMWRYLLL